MSVSHRRRSNIYFVPGVIILISVIIKGATVTFCAA